jgi:hypothetical protein
VSLLRADAHDSLDAVLEMYQELGPLLCDIDREASELQQAETSAPEFYSSLRENRAICKYADDAVTKLEDAQTALILLRAYYSPMLERWRTRKMDE